MNATQRNTPTVFSTALKALGLIVFILFLALPAFSQNTKGDRPEAGPGGKRESRFKSPFKKKNKQVKASYNRAQSKGVSRANSARKPSKPGRASQKIYPQKGKFVHNPSSKPSNKPRVGQGPQGGTRVNARSNTGKTRNVYPQYGRYTHNQSRTAKMKKVSPQQGQFVNNRSRTAKEKRVYPQYGQYVNNPSRRPRSVQKPVSNKSTLTRLNRLQSKGSPPPRKKIRIIPRSASGSFTARRSINVYANFPRPKHKGEQAYTKDIAGRKLRTKNFETQKPELTAPTYRPYFNRKRIGDHPYKGPAGGYRSATRTKPQAWTGDIAKRRIRGRNFTSKKNVEGQPILYHGRRARDRFGDRVYTGTVPGRGARSASQPAEKRTGKAPLPPRTPGIGADKLGKYQGSIKGRRPLKGGGSVSGRVWNNKGAPIVGRAPREGARAATFQGNIKGGRPLKGGGSVSGKMWNNKGVPIEGRAPREGLRAATFQGNIKRGRPLKGGGSVSGKLWNNKENPIPGRAPSREATKVAGFPGKLRRFEHSPGFNDQGEEYTGSTKAHKPLKGGGSVSGKLWNNKEKPTPGKVIPSSAKEVSGFPGKMKRFEHSPGFSDQGEEFTGHIRRPRFWKDYIKNPNSAEASLKKKRPTSATYQTGDLQVRVQQRPAGKRDNAPEGALPGLKPTKETIKASQYARGVRRNWDYIHNPSGSEEALRVREPGKAFAKSTDYQGNIKMQKFKLFEKNRGLHPDAQFVKTNKNNVDGERDLLTNFKLWWARLFKKQETQPDHLKDKGHKPRYDKGEEGLWYD